jgi:hypothetical protein
VFGDGRLAGIKGSTMTNLAKSSKREWAAVAAKRNAEMTALNGANWQAVTAEGGWLLEPYRYDGVKLTGSVDRFGWSMSEVAVVNAGDANPAGLRNAAVASEAPAMLDILNRIVVSLTETDLDPEMLLAECQSLIARVDRKASTLAALAAKEAK